MTNTITIPFEEHEDSPIEEGDTGSGLSFSRIFLCEYERRFDFLTEFFTGGIGGRPKSYHNLFPNLVASAFTNERIENKPFATNHERYLGEITDPESQIIGHDTLAKITIDFTPMVFNNDAQLQNGTFATYSQESSVEFIDFSGRGMKWEGSNKPLPADVRPVVSISNTRHDVHWSQVSDVPWGLLEAYKGSVNSVPFPIPGVQRVVPAGVLMFLGASSEQTIKYSGEVATNLTLTFAEKNQGALSSQKYGWNYKYDPDTKQYDRPISDGGAPLFPEVDLRGIFA